MKNDRNVNISGNADNGTIITGDGNRAERKTVNIEHTDVSRSKAGIVGHGARVGQIHFHNGERKYIPHVVIVTFGLISILTFGLVLLYFKSNPTHQPRNFWQEVFIVLLAGTVTVAVIFTLSKACKIEKLWIIFLILIPSFSIMTSLTAASCILGKPVYKVITGILSPEKPPTDNPLTPPPLPQKGKGEQKPDTSLLHPEQEPVSTQVVEPRTNQDIEPVHRETPSESGSSGKTGWQENKAPDDKITEPEITPQGDTFTNSIGMTFVYIEPDTFMMGEGNDRHKVTLTEGFYMQTTEVTQGQWKAVMGSYPPELYFKNCGDDCPVERVSWDDVQRFIQKLNKMEGGKYAYRLPTEAEWEYAARAGTTTAYYFGDDPKELGQYAWYDANSGSKTHPVGQLKPNAFGLYDMHGNVWEWCQDWYGDYPSGDVTNPTGPETGSSRVYRGGSWGHSARNCRAAFRAWFRPDSRYGDLGFRLLCFQVNRSR